MEMNIFVPQSIQTQIELEEIADVKRQIISPSSSSTSIGLVQDGLVGAYNLTGPTVKIDWRNAMNIISYTSFENMKKLDKERTFTGQEVFTLIIPPGINIHGDNNFRVKDSVLTEGSRLSKDVLGEKKKFALHQLIWDEYGTEETKTFIDNAQKLMNNFNLYNGFTVGYGDACVDKSVNENIDKLFITINQKIDHMITELENNPEMMDKDVFEYKLQQEFGIVLDSVSKVVIASLDPENSFYVMSDKGSGSKGSTKNIGQIIGCLGLQAIEGKIAPKKYNNRTLPYFHQHDDRGASRGLVREPYIDGLTFPSFTFLLMAGREGIIDQALKTAETGYAQRRLVKSEEDVMIKYDCTVRTANEMLLQLVYGDSGADTTKQYLYNIDLAKMSNEELKNRFSFSSEELKNFKDYKPSDNDKLFNMIKSMRDEFRYCMKKARCDFRTVVTKVAFPVNFTRILDNISANKSLQKGELVQPLYVHEQIEKILDNKYLTLIPMSQEQRDNKDSVKNVDEKIFKSFLKIALYNALAPKKCCIEKKFSKLQFDTIITDIVATYNRSVVQPGEMVGVIGAQSMGEPLTQMSNSSLSKIIIKNKSTNDIYYGPVGKFVDNILEENKKNVKKVPEHKDSVVYKPKDEYYIIGVSDTEKTSWNKISEFSRHPANGKLMTITTKTKRKTTTTLSHSHLARVNHKVVPIKGSDLKVGDRIPIVLTVNMPESKRKSIKIGEKDYKLNKDFGWFCGAYIADGCIYNNTIKVTKIIPIFETRIKKIAETFGKELRVNHYEGEYGPGKDQIFTHKELAQFLETNFGNGSYNKKIPAFAYDSNEDFVSGLIGGYFDGDGNFDSKRCAIRVGSRSKELIEGLSLLLSYFGIFGSFVDETTMNQPGKILHTYQVMRKYDTIFKEKIFLCVKEKIAELKEIIKVNSREKKMNTNFIDMIPGLGESIAFIGKKLKLPGQSRTYGRWLKKPAIGRDTLGSYLETFTEAVEKYEPINDDDTEDKTKEEVQVHIEKLKQAFESEVIWDEIVSIDILDDPKEYVYDFTVPGNDSFMVDAGVLVHNTLNTFHVAGIKTMSSTTHGVPRVKEILGVSKNLRTPQLLMQLKPEFSKNKDMARKVASNLKYTTIGDIRGRINILYDPEPDEGSSIIKEDNVKQVYYNQKSSKNSCQSDYKGLPWVMRIEIVKEKMLEKEISLLDIKSKFCNWWEKRFIDSKLLKKEEKKVINKITNIAVLSNTDNDFQPVIHIRFNVKDADKTKDPFNREMLNEFIDQIIDKFKLKGIESITNINDIAPEKLMVIDEETGELKQEEHYMIYTAGTNLIDIRYLVGVDIYKTVSNDIVDVYKHFGIEVARTRLLRELYDAYDQAGHTVSYTNISILVDIMTSNGILMSIDRHGMNKSDTDVLGRASFERAVDQILTAGVFGETDHMKGVSSRVMAGLVIKGGTGYCDVILDTNTIEKSEYSDETNKYRTHIEIQTDGVAKDIMKNDTGDMFIPE